MNKKAFMLTLMISLFIFAVNPCFSLEFQPLGFMPLSMGGAGVASAKGSYAPYYNPALVAEKKHATQVSLSVGVGIREVNLAEHIDNLADSGIDESIRKLTESIEGGGILDVNVQEDIKLIKSTLQSISRNNGLQLMPNVHLSVQAKSYGFGLFGLSEVTAHAVIDPQRLDFIVNTGIGYFKYDENENTYTLTDSSDYENNSLDYALENGLTYLKLTGLAYTEIFLSHARTLSLTSGELNVGGTLKVMPGYAYDEEVKIDTESDEVDNEFKDQENKTTSWGVDAGMLYKPKRFEKLALGLVLKNLNTPGFKTKYGNKLRIRPQVRSGISYDCWNERITLAADIDITNNKTFIPGYESQFIGAGAGFHPYSWLSLRTGIMNNIRESHEGTILTAGLGIGVKWLQLDIAGQMSTKKTEYDREDIPNYAQVQVSLLSKWF